MKAFIFGIAMFMTGALGIAVLCGAAMQSNYIGDSLYFVDLWHLYGVTGVAVFFLIVGLIGLVVLVLELLFSVLKRK